MPITIPHNRLDLWYDSIKTFFKIIFFTTKFWSFFANCGHICRVQVNGKKFQVQTCVFSTSEMKSTLNLSLENIFCFMFWSFLFPHPFGRKTVLKPQTLSQGGSITVQLAAGASMSLTCLMAFLNLVTSHNLCY